MSLKSIAEHSGVNYATMLSTIVGHTAGVTVTKKVNAFITKENEKQRPKSQVQRPTDIPAPISQNIASLMVES
jgi:hypothetical protein